MEYEDCDEDQPQNSVVGSIFTMQRIKVSIALIIAYFMTTTNMFIDLVLSKIPGATENGKTTERGNLLCAVLIVLVYFLADLAIQADYI